MAYTVVMTGATRGIGRVAVERILAGAPEAVLVLPARDPGGIEVATRLSRGGRTVVSIPTDLTSLRGVRIAADEITRRVDAGVLPPLRLLVANAGLQHTDDTTETAEGFEATFAVNVLANHVLVRRLQDRLAAPSRIVVTVSDTHFGDFRHNMGMVPAPMWRAPEELARVRAFPAPDSTAAGRTAYSTSKLAAIHLVHEYARRLPRGVDVVGFNPGFVPGTDLARDAGPLARFAVRRVMPLLAFTPMATGLEAAGRHLADAALGNTPATTGGYVDRAAAARSSDESYDPERERQLWEAVERLTADHVR